MAVSILVSIIALQFLLILEMILMFFAKRFLVHHSAGTRYKLWKLIFVCIPISFVILLCKATLPARFGAWSLSTIHLPSAPNSVASRVIPHQIAGAMEAMLPQLENQNHNQPLILHFSNVAATIAVIYCAGILLGLIYVAIRYGKMANHIMEHRSDAPPALIGERDQLCDFLQVRHIPIFVTEMISTPMLFGGVRTPMILVPPIDCNTHQWHYIFRHELTHLKRGDLVWKLLSTIGVCLMWCNPLVYWAKQQIDQACELACDEAVVGNASFNEKKDYARTLIDCIALGNLGIEHSSLSFSSEGGYRQMQNRIQSVMADGSRKTGNGVLFIFGSVLFTLLIAGSTIRVDASTEAPQFVAPKIVISLAQESQQNSEKKNMTVENAYGTPLPELSPTYDENNIIIRYSVATGTPVHSASNGIVVEAEQAPMKGVYLVVQNENEERFHYAHLESFSVKVGDKVEVGDVIGLSGNTGNAPKEGSLAFYVKNSSNESITAEISARF